MGSDFVLLRWRREIRDVLFEPLRACGAGGLGQPVCCDGWAACGGAAPGGYVRAEHKSDGARRGGGDGEAWGLGSEQGRWK